MQKALIIGRPTIALESTDSTNDYASMLVSNSNPNEGTVICAQHQSRGKGQIGSKWESEPGANLLMSVILKPQFVMANQQFALNMIASLAIKDALNSFHINAQIKWPNDIYVGKKKICGILIQNILAGKSLKHAIVGVGLNVNQEKFDPKLPNPTSIAIKLGHKVDLNEVKSRVCKCIQTRYIQLQEDGWPDIETDYLHDLYLRDKQALYLVDTQEKTGIIKGISPIGELLLEVDGTINKYGFKEVKYMH